MARIDLTIFEKSLKALYAGQGKEILSSLHLRSKGIRQKFLPRSRRNYPKSGCGISLRGIFSGSHGKMSRSHLAGGMAG